MRLNSLLVTGQQGFLTRYHLLFESLARRIDQVRYLSYEEVSNTLFDRAVNKSLRKIAYRISYRLGDNLFYKSARVFRSRARKIEARIHRSAEKPDLILHVFSTSCPQWIRHEVPYAMYLDYTMALAARNWQPWTPFGKRGYQAWMGCETHAYQKARHLFCMSNLVNTSLIQDYGIGANNISVVGGSANFDNLFKGEKPFGSRQILFNGSNFQRKGGDLAVESFRLARQILPDAKLIIVGDHFPIREPGVVCLGHVRSREEMQTLFIGSDVVIAPSYCDPFPTFVLEALHFGVPCIVPDRDGMPEIITHQVNGLVIPEYSASAWAKGILDLLQDRSRLEAMSHAGKETIKKRFNWDRVADQMLEILLTRRA